MAVVVGFDEAGFAESELAETPFPVVLPGEQTAAVEALVVLDAHEAAPFPGFLFDLHGLSVLQHQRLDAEDVLIEGQDALEHGVMQLVGQRDDDHLIGFLFGQHLLVEFGITAVGLSRSGAGVEGLVGEGPLQRLAFAQRGDGGTAHIHHGDVADDAFAAHLERRGQQQIVDDHARPDNGQIERFLGFTHLEIPFC